jgi:hypothetical protein
MKWSLRANRQSFHLPSFIEEIDVLEEILGERLDVLALRPCVLYM